MKKIAVVGGGSTGHMVAADVASRGHEARLCDSEAYREILEQTAAIGKIALSGSGFDTVGELAMATTDVARALDGADLVICCTIANRDEEVAEMIAPHVPKDGVVLLSAGSAGSLVYRRVFNRLGRRDIVVGETSGNLYPCRMIGPGKVFSGGKYAPKAAAAVPERDTERLVEAFSGVYELMPASCVLETAFNGPNLIAHIDLTLLNAGAIETAKGPYRVFKDGICRSTINLADALWQEKKRVMDALGFACGPSPAGFYRKLSDHDAHAFDGFRALEGPESLTGRYITEDVPMLDCLFLSVARAIGVATPLFEGLVAVASAVNQTDYYAQGRTLESLGIEARTPAEIAASFRDPGNLQ